MHEAFSGWPRPRNFFSLCFLIYASKTPFGITVFEQAKILTKAAALILTVAGIAECLLWRFSSHPEHSSLLLARNLITGYDLPSQEQAATAKCALFSGRFLDCAPSM